MPELPEVCLYVNALDARITGQPIERVRLRSPSLLKTFDPPVSALVGKHVRAVGRIGKRIALHLDDDLHAVIHLMIAGRFQWRDAGAPLPGKRAAGGLDFPNGTLVLTEASTKKRMSMWVVRGDEALRLPRPGGRRTPGGRLPGFQAALVRENRTLKRALTDPRILSGIGNAHSDEILLAAGLSPVRLTRRLSTGELRRLYEATRTSLREWIERLQDEAGGDFPKKVTAFHPAMAAHGKFGKPCPGAAPRFSASSTPAARRTIARNVRRGAGCWPTGRCPGSWVGTGRARWKSWRQYGRRTRHEEGPQRCRNGASTGARAHSFPGRGWAGG